MYRPNLRKNTARPSRLFQTSAPKNRSSRLRIFQLLFRLDSKKISCPIFRFCLLNFEFTKVGTVPPWRDDPFITAPDFVLTENITSTVRVPRFELGTSSLSVTRSNQLSYTRALDITQRF